MKVIFLDIDGVLNVELSERDAYGKLFHPHLVDNLRHIVEQTGADIVITSTWKSKGLKTLQNMWRYRNLPGRVIDVTQYCDEVAHEQGIQYYDQITRGHEVQHWINKNPRVTNWVMIDDDLDIMPEQRSNFVRTANNKHHSDSVDIGFGLTKICAEKAIKILNIKNGIK